ncbi:MAG TPA: hypothetical protein VNO70_16645 [Blastocatellia bacterium]|nr:hypothetical protein [Blastocatellia bacterium]
MKKSDLIAKAAKRPKLTRREAARGVEATLDNRKPQTGDDKAIHADGLGRSDLRPQRAGFPPPVGADKAAKRKGTRKAAKGPHAESNEQEHTENHSGGEMEERHEEEQNDKEPTGGEGKALGLDVGTSRIVLASGQADNIKTSTELNAFISIPYSKFTESVLKKNKVHYHRDGDEWIQVYGNEAGQFANVFNTEVRRPMMGGILNPAEEQGLALLNALINQLLRKSKHNEEMRFSVPGPSRDGGTADLVYHEAVIKNMLHAYGYNAKGVNEGLAVVFAEMERDNFSGIGISCGGGMCNVCLAFMSLPVISFSISKAGDYIDQSVASVTGEKATRIRLIKEEGLDLSQPPKNKYENALHVYYDDVILSLVEALRGALVETRNVPKLDRAIPIVLSGGTSKPKGFLEKFRDALEQDGFPLEISEIRMAEDPLTATARGCLIAALYDA